MEIFLIFYGLIEATNSIYVYKGKNKYNLYITLFWGISFVFVGLIEIFNFTQLWEFYAYEIWGISWFTMIVTPCGIPIFRINKTTKLIRILIFTIIGIYQIYFSFSFL